MPYRCIALFASLLFCLSACSRTDETALATRVLRVGVSEEPDALNPLFSHTAVADDVAALTLAPLFRYDDAGRLIPELAVRVPTFADGGISTDGRRVTLQLRRNLRWSDGMPLTVRDLVYTWHAVMNPLNDTKLRSGWNNITAMSVRNDETVIVRLRRADATVLSLFAGGGDAAYPPLPAHLLAISRDINHALFNAAPLSSGPWLLTAWQHGSALTFRPNPRYWRGAPQIEELRFMIYPQADSLMTALRTGEIDFVDTVPEDRIAFLATIPRVQAYPHTVATYRHLDFNLRDPILRDARVRRALIESVPWARLLATVYHASGTRALSDIFPSSFAAPQLPPYRYDPADAERLLDASGWRLGRDGVRTRGGLPLSLTIMSASSKATSAQAELQIAAAVERVGVHIVQKNVPVSYLFAQDGPLYTGRYQLAWAADTRGPDPDNAADWTTAAQPPNGANTVFLSDRIVDETAAAARATFDLSRRRAFYQREEERLHDLAPSFIFTWDRATLAASVRLHGLRPAPFYSDFWNSWQWRLH